MLIKKLNDNRVFDTTKFYRRGEKKAFLSLILMLILKAIN